MTITALSQIKGAPFLPLVSIYDGLTIPPDSFCWNITSFGTDVGEVPLMPIRSHQTAS
jgi:hypothetical protein